MVLPFGGLRGQRAAHRFTEAFIYMFAVPILNGASQAALWQSKVAPGLQGRVFAVRRMVAWSTLPLAYLIAGPWRTTFSSRCWRPAVRSRVSGSSAA